MDRFDEALTKTSNEAVATALLLIVAFEPNLGEKSRKTIIEAAKRLVPEDRD